jgi:hypothetical protein
MNTKKLISKYLAALWLCSVLGFLGLQVGFSLAQSSSAKVKHPGTSEIVLVAAHPGQATDVSPDLKLLPVFLLPDSDNFRIVGQAGILSGFVFHALLQSDLTRFLKASISINAP